VAGKGDISEGKGLLIEIVSMLTGLTKAISPDRVREAGGVYYVRGDGSSQAVGEGEGKGERSLRPLRAFAFE